MKRRFREDSLHWLAMACFSKDLGGHVSWSSTSCSQNVKLLFIHNSRQSKISNEQVCVILWCPEQQVLGFQISMHNAVIMEVGDSRKCGPNKISRVRLVVITLAADAVEQLASERKVGDKVDCTQLNIRYDSKIW
jgi:hypothetical protein